jgi:methylase of polypeptide subunit release factors
LLSAEKAVNAALAATEKAVAKAEIAQQRINMSQEEFRETLKDQAAIFIPRSESENNTMVIREQLQDVKTRLDLLQGAAVGKGSQLSTIMSIGAVILAMLSVGLNIYQSMNP